MSVIHKCIIAIPRSFVSLNMSIDLGEHIAVVPRCINHPSRQVDLSKQFNPRSLRLRSTQHRGYLGHIDPMFTRIVMSCRRPSVCQRKERHLLQPSRGLSVR